jgi:hypothetical protein
MKRHRFVDDPAPEKSQRPAEAPSLRPAMGRPQRELTPEELVQVQALYEADLVRPAPANLKRREENHHMAADRIGEPCSCGAKDRTPCLAHHAILGHRRNVRP